MENQIFIVVNGKPAGPYTLDELKEIDIKADTFIKFQGMADYKEAHEIPEIRELLGFKHTVTLPQYYATLDLRLLAVAIDYFLVTALYLFIAIVVVSFIQDKYLKVAIPVTGSVLILLIKFVYAILMEASKRQGTFGKFWLGLKVCDEQGLPISPRKSFVRNVSKFLSFLTLGIGYLAGFFSKKQQCLHDRIAHTMVIKDRLI